MLKKNREITLKVLAKKCHVSPSTVSRVLNNKLKAGNYTIGPKVTKRVLKMAKRLNYMQDIRARSLAGGKIQTIAIAVWDTIHFLSGPTIYSEIIDGALNAVAERNFSLLIHQRKNDEEGLQKTLNLFRAKKISGLILLYAHGYEKEVDALIKGSYPFVVLFDKLKGYKRYNLVDNDNLDSTCEAVTHLIKMGHKKIAAIVANVGDRLKGYKKALMDNSIKIDEKMIKPGDYSLQHAQKSMEELLRLKHPPTAIFAGTDVLALGAREIILKKNLKIPDDIAIVGFDDNKFIVQQFPDLTTVHFPTFEVGREAAYTLIDIIEGRIKGPVKKIMPSKLVIRGSCGYKLQGKVESC